MKIIMVVVLLISCTVLLLQIDDELNDEVNTLIASQKLASQSDAYLYLIGIYASENESPLSLGKQLYEEYKQLESDNLYSIKDYPDSKRLVLPEGDLFCKGSEQSCVQNLFNTEIDEELLDSHKILLSRVNEFYRFDEFTTLSKPSVDEIPPPYRYISMAERIKVLSAIKAHKEGRTIDAINKLTQQLSVLRRSLSLQDNLIAKMVFLAKMFEVVDVLHRVNKDSNIELQPIQALSLDEKTLKPAIAREFAMISETLQNLDGHPEFFQMGGNFPGWKSRMVYKPNMSLNAIAPFYTRVGWLSELSPDEFALAAEQRLDLEVPTSRIRNFVGYILINVAVPDFDQYVARFMDFDAKLVLFNHLHADVEDVSNPYYFDEKPIRNDGMMCFRGPLEDQSARRCLMADSLLRNELIK